MADMERPEQELTPGYYDDQFGRRVRNITKRGYAPPGPSGGSQTGGGCLKGGGAIVFGLVLVVRLLMSEGCRGSHHSPNSYTSPYVRPTTPNFQNHDPRLNRGGQRLDENQGDDGPFPRQDPRIPDRRLRVDEVIPGIDEEK